MLTQRQIYAVIALITIVILIIGGLLLSSNGGNSANEASANEVVFKVGDQKITKAQYDAYLEKALGVKGCQLNDKECQEALETTRKQVAQRFLSLMTDVEVAKAIGVKFDTKRAKEDISSTQIATSEEKLPKELQTYFKMATYANSQIQIRANKGVSNVSLTQKETAKVQQQAANMVPLPELRSFSVFIFDDFATAKKAQNVLQQNSNVAGISKANSLLSNQNENLSSLLTQSLIEISKKSLPQAFYPAFAGKKTNIPQPIKYSMNTNEIKKFFPYLTKAQTTSLTKGKYYLLPTSDIEPAQKYSRAEKEKAVIADAKFQKQQAEYQKNLQALQNKFKGAKNCSSKLDIKNCL